MQTDKRPLFGLARFGVACLAAVLGVAGLAHGQGAGIDPADVWLQAYSLFQEAEEAEKNGNLLDALSKYNQSQPLFDSLGRDYPDFHPDLVRYRRQMLAGKVQDLKERMRGSTGGHYQAPATPQPSVDQGVQMDSLQPVSPEFQAPAQPEMSGGVELPQPWRPGAQPGGPSAAPPGQPLLVRPPGGSVGQGEARESPRLWENMPAPQTPNSNPLASSLEQVNRQFEVMRSEIDRLNRQNTALSTELSNKQAQLDQSQLQLQQAQARVSQLEVESRQARRNPNLEAKVTQLESLLKESLEQLRKADQLNRELFAEREATRAEIDRLKREKEDVEKERDHLKAIVANGGEDSIAQLMEENQRLREKISLAEETARKMSKDSEKSQGELLVLKEQIARIQKDRDRLARENQRYEAHIAELTSHLKSLGQEVANIDPGDAPAGAAPELSDEKKLLYDVVVKHLRRQSQIKQTKALLLQELDKLGVKAESLFAMVEDIASGPSLSPEERQLFKEPEMSELVDATAVEAVQGTILVEGKETDGSGTGILQIKDVQEELLQVQKAARLDFQEGRYEDAEKNYLKYLEFRPRSVVCLCNLALVKLTTKKYPEAEELLEKAIALKNDHGTAYYLLGRSYFEQGRLDDALNRLDEGLHYDPKNAKAQNCVGVISTQKGFAKRAEEAFKAAVEIDPEYADAHFNLAVFYATGEKPNAGKVEEHYLKAVHLGVPRDAAIENFITASASGATVSQR
ncbi:MAG: tetratricopeptide repeat protein [Akkermansiaceae bacterium]|nr:tetratricopeptide repeat protein [Akkermansiaceae bacterium]